MQSLTWTMNKTDILILEVWFEPSLYFHNALTSILNSMHCISIFACQTITYWADFPSCIFLEDLWTPKVVYMCNGVITSGRNSIHWFIMFNSLLLHTSLGSLGANLLWWGFYWNNVLGNRQTDFLINISMCLNVRAGCALKPEWMVKLLTVRLLGLLKDTIFQLFNFFSPFLMNLKWFEVSDCAN